MIESLWFKCNLMISSPRRLNWNDGEKEDVEKRRWRTSFFLLVHTYNETYTDGHSMHT